MSERSEAPLKTSSCDRLVFSATGLEGFSIFRRARSGGQAATALSDCLRFSSTHIGDLIIRTGFGGILYYYDEEPPKPYLFSDRRFRSFRQQYDRCHPGRARAQLTFRCALLCMSWLAENKSRASIWEFPKIGDPSIVP